MGGAYTGDNYPNTLYENPGHGSHWLKLALAGRKANRAGLGARLKLTVGTPDGQRLIHHTVSTGGSFGSNPLRQEIGLGNGTNVLALDVWWPGSGTRQTVGPLAANAAYTVREGEAEVTRIVLKSFRFPAAGAASHHHPQHH